MTIAVADSILNEINYIETFKTWGRKYPNSGYGGRFHTWLFSEDTQPYNSWGNGSAMRVSPVGYAFEDIDSIITEAKKSAEVTHNHLEGIKGAQVTAAAIFLARNNSSKEEIKSFITNSFHYDLNRKLDDIRPIYQFNESCQETVPEAIIAFLESNNYEDAIRKSISIGGDSDTLACICGGIAQAFYKDIPAWIIEKAKFALNDDILDIIRQFNQKYKIEYLKI